MPTIYKVLAKSGLECPIDKRTSKTYPFNWVGAPDKEHARYFEKGEKAKPPLCVDIEKEAKAHREQADKAAAEAEKKAAEQAKKEQEELVAKATQALADATNAQVEAAKQVEALKTKEGATAEQKEAAQKVLQAANAALKEAEEKGAALEKQLNANR
jgi:chromosome segregation ATPase